VTERICDSGQKVSLSSCQTGGNSSPNYYQILGMKCRYNVALRRGFAATVTVESIKDYTLQVCVLGDIVIHHALHKIRTVIYRLLGLQYFSTSFHKKNDFLLKKMCNINSVFWFTSNFSNISHSNDIWAKYNEKCKL
jgi:hypothetical protein